MKNTALNSIPNRNLINIINTQTTQDGDGVKIRRLAGRNNYQSMNPFLMIDEIKSDDAADYIGGFPEHPHRGFQTITYMKTGLMRHRDHIGNEGVIGPGDVQWMTAGAGVLHSEMPEQDQGLLHGFQIWLNLPAKEKMKPAAYQEITSQQIAEIELPQKGLARVIAGTVTINSEAVSSKTVTGPLPEISTTPVFIDANLSASSCTEFSFNADNLVLVYVYKGSTDQLQTGQMGVYSTGEILSIIASSEGSEILILSAQVIDEPVAQYGPFVMNTREEIEQALYDFRNQEYLKSLTSS